MATAQMQRPKSKTQNWSSIFPEEQVTEVQSMLFVKKLLAVAVSSVTYLRAIFPENSFGDRCLEDLKLKILREDNGCPGACQVIQWMKGCFDALDKKYLRMILIGIYDNPDDPDTVIERYTFKMRLGVKSGSYDIATPKVDYTDAAKLLYATLNLINFSYKGSNAMDLYRNEEKIIGTSTEEETKKATVRLLRTLILLSQTLSPLPDDVMMTMKLLYYDDVTPVDYQPPGFQECDSDAFSFKDEAMDIKVGSVATPFHAMKLKIGTIYHLLRYKDEEVIPGEEKESVNANNEEENSVRVPDTCPAKQDEHVATDTEEPLDAAKRIPDTYDNSNGAKVQIDNPLPMEDEPQEEEPTVLCPCGVNEDDGMMILCAACEAWQHAVCFAILDSEKAPATHFCVSCSKKFDAHKCTDQRLEKLSESELKATCLWRRTLVSVVEMNRVTGNCLAKRLGVEASIANQIVKRLEKEGYVKTTSKNKRLGKLVDKKKITDHAMRNYFRLDEDDSDSVPVEIIGPNDEENLSSMVAKASKLEIAEEAEPRRNKSKSLETKMIEIKQILQTKGNGRKRAVSTLNADDEFEISNSQDIPEILEERLPAKRKKASSVLHALPV